MSKICLLTVSALLVLGFSSAQAAEFRSNEDSLTVSSEEQPKDLYLSSGSVNVESDVAGDLMIAGGSVNVNGQVEGSLFIAAGNITVQGLVGRHVRLAGGTVTFSGSAKGDVLIAGGTVTLTSSAVIDGDLLVSGGSVTMQGTVKGKTRMTGQSAVIGGSLGETFISSDKVQLNGQTEIKGNLEYHSPRQAEIDPKASISGRVDYRPIAAINRWSNFLSPWRLLSLLGMMLLAWLMIRFLPRTSSSVVKLGIAKMTLVVGVGALVIVGGPIIGFILLFSVVGWPLAIIVLLGWLMLIVLGIIKGSLIFGAWLVKVLTKEEEIKLDLQAIVVGFLGLALIGLIPYIGGLVRFVFVLAGIGSSTLYLRRLRDPLVIEPNNKLSHPKAVADQQS